MDPSELDGLVLRLVTNPQDEQALVLAHHEGESDPAGYAALLERVAQETQDPAYASHWLAEAATIWSTTLGDSHRAARLLMKALALDPSQQTAHNRLADLYRESDDIKALVALLEQRARVLSPSTEDPEVCAELSPLHVELGRLWGERVGQPKKALENFRRALELDATNAFAIYSARELFKASGRIHEALAMYEAEIAIADPDRKVVLLRDEAATRRDAGDFVGATYALVRAHSLAPDDPELTHEAGSSILARIEGGEDVPPEERMGGANLFVDLADRYDGDAGLAYAGTALDLAPSHDRALQLYLYFATTLERTDDAKVRAAAYLAASPRGALRDEATRRLAPSPAPSSPPREIPAPARYNTEDPTLDGSDPFPLRPDTLPPVSLVVVLEQAHALATKGRKGEALAKYKQVLDADPAHPEALRWVEDHLRTRRDHASLRDVLMSAVHAMPASAATLEMRRRRLREVASLCEGNLRDLDGAILAHQQLYALDPTDTAARTSLERLFERVHRWDELASLFEQQASLETLAAKKIALEKHAAQIHETRRQDLIAAAEAWTRIASLASDDPASLATAAQLYERAERPSLAADVLAEGVHSVRPGAERVQLCERLGALREQHGAWLDAGDAYLQAAEASRQAQHWEMAERAFVKASAWGQAAHAAEQLASIAPHAEAPHLTRAAEHMIHAGDHAGAEEHLIHAVAIDPSNDRYAARLTEVLDRSAKWTLLASVLAKRAAAIDDPSRRIAERRNVARLYAAHGAPAIARSAWLDVLNDGDDVDALEALAADASADPAEAAAFLRRRLSLTAPADRADVARRLVSLYDRLGDRDGAIDALEQILAADPEDFDVLVRLADLCEEAEKWDRVAELLARRVEVEADESEAAAAAKRRAEILEVRLGREDDALASLEELADHGVQELRDAYVALADRLGWKGLIASKLVHWWLAAPPSPERTSALVEAFHCFVGVDRVEEACRVGLELARGDHLDRALAKTLEGVACADPNALATAHQVLLRGLSGTERMDELLRQAPLADPQRARRLLDEVLRESASPELLASLDALTEDAPKGLRRTLAEALAEAGQGAHDGGRTRGNYLLRAASLARELGELDQVFAWLTEALASCGTLAALDALDALGSAPEILVRVEGALDRAIDEVFDGPLVRELLLRRASLRRGANPEGAVSDLQRLHELLPGDEVVFDQLVELLRQLGDRVRLAALLEEHLGRGQAPASRKKLQELQTALGSIEEAPEPCTRETAAVSEPPSTLAESARTTVPGHRPVNVPPADDDILVVDEFADTVVPEV